MVADKVIHFGYFLREKRGALSRAAFAAKVEILDSRGFRKGLTEKRLWEIEKKADAEGMFARTFNGIAAALGMTPDELDAQWKATPVSVPKDEAHEGEGLPTRNARAVLAWADAMVAEVAGAREGFVKALADGFAGREAKDPDAVEEPTDAPAKPVTGKGRSVTRSYQAPVPLTPLQRQQIEAVAKQAKGGGARGEGGRP